MAYSPDYTESDVTAATIDGAGKFVIVFAGFAGIIALVLLAGWGYGRLKK